MTNNWDVAQAALRRIATPLSVASREVPDFQASYRALAKALGLPSELNHKTRKWLADTQTPAVDDESNTAADHLLETLGIDLSGADWLDSDFSWLLHSSDLMGYDGLPGRGEAAF